MRIRNLFGALMIGAALSGTPAAATTTSSAEEEGATEWLGATESPAAEGEVVRPVNSSWMLEGGTSHLVDSYLSPLKYKGWHGALTYRRLQAWKYSPERWVEQAEVEVVLDNADNPARNSSLLHFNFASDWGMLRRWRLPHSITVGAGATAGVSVGAFYSSRNGNNPVAAQADAHLAATLMTSWATRLWRVPLLLTWDSSLPLTGAFFSPAYDELYYEIYLGNRKGLVHPLWPGNFFRWNNRLTADLDLGPDTRIRLGVGARAFSSQVNNITTRAVAWSVILGVTSDWISLSPRRGVPSAASRTVYAY